MYLRMYFVTFVTQTESSMYSANRYYRNQRVVIPLWPLIIQNKPIYQLRWGVNNPTQWSIDNIYIGKHMYVCMYVNNYVHI